MKTGILGVGSIACGLLGVLIHWPGASLALRTEIQPITGLSLLGILLFAVLAASGIGLLSDSAWAPSIARKISVGLVIITALGATGSFVLAQRAPVRELAAIGYKLLAAQLVVGLLWPVIVVAALDRRRGRN